MDHLCLESTREYVKELEAGLANAPQEFTKVYIGVNKDGYICGISDAYEFQRRLMEEPNYGKVKRRVDVVATNHVEENLFYGREVPLDLAGKPENLILRNKDQEARRVMVSLGYDEEEIQEMFAVYKRPGEVRNYLVVTIPGRQGVEVGGKIYQAYEDRIDELFREEIVTFMTLYQRHMEGSLPAEGISLTGLSREIMEKLRKRVEYLTRTNSYELGQGRVSEMSDEELLERLGFYNPMTRTINRAGVCLFFSEPSMAFTDERIYISSLLGDKIVYGPVTQAVDKTLELIYRIADAQSREWWDKGLEEVIRNLFYIAYVQKEMNSPIRVYLDGYFLQIGYPVSGSERRVEEDVTYSSIETDKTLYRGLLLLEDISEENVTEYCRERRMPRPHRTDSISDLRLRTITLTYPLGIEAEETAFGRMHAQCISQFVPSWSFPGLWN